MWWRGVTELARVEALLAGYRNPSVPGAAVTEYQPSSADEPTSTGFARWWNELAEQAALSTMERSRMLSVTAVLTAVASLSVFVAPPLLAFLLIAAPAFIQIQRVKFRAARRRSAFDADYTAFLLSLASSIRTGLDPLAALLGLEPLFAEGSEMRKEIRRTAKEIDAGRSEEAAITGFAASLAHPDVPLFTTAFILSRQEGASLGECLQRLARVTRQRQSFRRKVRAAVAMQKMSAFGIAGCALVIGIMQMVATRDGVALALADPLGRKLLAIGAGLLLAGIFWMMRMAAPGEEG